MDVNHYDDAKIALIESRCKSNTQDGVTYLCNRNTGNPVYHPLIALVGLYVEAVSEEPSLRAQRKIM